MAASLGTLTLDLIAKIGGFTAPMDQAERSARKNAKGIKESADEAASAWQNLGAVAAGAFVGISVGGLFTRFITETRDAEKEQAQLSAALRSTGEAAGFNRDQLNEMAGALEKTSTFSGGDINKAQTALLAFTGVVGNEFNRAMQSAVDMAARTGTTVEAAAETIGRALDVPSKGLTALSKQGFRFTDEQKKLALALESTGDVAGAQGIILQALEESYAGAAAAARGTFGGSLEALQHTISGLLTGEGSLESARIAAEALNSVLASPAAKAALELTAKAAIAVALAMTARLAASLVGTAAAFVLAQAEAVRYQLALARLAGVTSTAAVGITAVGVAARGASAAMALLGGPVGLAMLAASALAYFVLRSDEADESSGKLAEKVDWLNKSFEGFSKNQARSALQDINGDLIDAQLAAIDAESAVSQYQRLLKEHPDDARQREWNSSLITAQGELDTARQKVSEFGEQINRLNGILAAPVEVAKSAVFKKMAADLDEQILLVDKKTAADKLAAKIGAGLIKGLKDGEGELLIAKQRTLDAGEKAAKAEKKRAADAKTAAKTAATAAATAASQLKKRYEDSETGYQREIELINTTADKRKKASELSKLAFEIESGKLVGINAKQQQRLKDLAAELDVRKLLKEMAEDDAKVAAFAAAQAATNQSAKDGLELELAGAGRGDKTKERLKNDLAIRQQYAQDIKDLNAQLNSDAITADVYERETAILEDAFGKRLSIQQEYYEAVDEAQNNWMDGVTTAWENYVDNARDYSQMANDFVTSQLDTLTSSVGDAFSAMIMENQSLGESFRNVASAMLSSIVNALSQMAAEWLVYQAVQLVVGKATQASAVPALIANAQATAFQASLAAFASTAAIPIVGPALAPAAAATAAGFTAPMVAGVATAALAGMAHDGIDSIPETGTWLLQKGERVTTAETSAKLDATLASIQASNDSRQAPRRTGSPITQNNYYPTQPDNRTANQSASALARKQRQASRLK